LLAKSIGFGKAMRGHTQTAGRANKEHTFFVRRLFCQLVQCAQTGTLATAHSLQGPTSDAFAPKAS